MECSCEGTVDEGYAEHVHPLLRAIVTVDLELVSEYLASNPDAVNMRFEDSYTPLLHATAMGEEPLVDLLLQ